MTGGAPRISVVVTTKDRSERLAATLAGLRAQTLPRSEFEVIVVDDASADPRTKALLEDELRARALDLRALESPFTRGQAGARNDGWRAARAPLVAFTDDDCVPDAGWLRAALEAAGRESGVIIQGRTEPEPAPEGYRRMFSRTVIVRTLGPQYQTCNIVYPRALLERLGGFDEAFGPPVVGEDTDLAWRAIEAGARTAFAPDALVIHAVHRLGPLGMLREATRWTDAPRVFARHPGARVILNRRLFWNGWHYLVFRSLFALALPKPARRYLLTRHALQLVARAHDAGAGAWAVPYLLLYDLVEIAAITRGGVRHRTLVL
jgi:GT2 family glycosyltransferase